MIGYNPAKGPDPILNPVGARRLPQVVSYLPGFTGKFKNIKYNILLNKGNKVHTKKIMVNYNWFFHPR